MAFIELLLRLMIRSYCATLRVSLMLPDGTLIPLRKYDLRRVVFAHSERISLAIAPALLYAPFLIMLAPGRDGDRAAYLFRSTGFTLVRGSTLHSGSSALRQLIGRLANHPGPAAISVDGPVGPLGVPKPGIISCASHTGRPIIPLGAAAKHRIIFRKSWSQIFLPLPGSRVVIVTDHDMNVPGALSRSEIEKLGRELAERLRLAEERAERVLA